MKRILLVDDEPMILRIMRVALEDKGYLVESANNGEQALEIVEAFAPDAVITDIDMPRMNGRQLCTELRKHYPPDSLPIFVVTAKTAVEHRAWSTLINNLHFLEKPVSIRKLCNQLDTTLQEAADTQATCAS